MQNKSSQSRLATPRWSRYPIEAGACEHLTKGASSFDMTMADEMLWRTGDWSAVRRWGTVSQEGGGNEPEKDEKDPHEGKTPVQDREVGPNNG